MTDPAPFHPAAMLSHRRGHIARLGLRYRAHGPDWAELELPWSPALSDDPDAGTAAAGPVFALMDVATSMAVWSQRGAFVPHATLDLRLDRLRGHGGRALVGRGECYRLTPELGFVRGLAHEGDPDDPVAHVAGTFMVLGMVLDTPA